MKKNRMKLLIILGIIVIVVIIAVFLFYIKFKEDANQDTQENIEEYVSENVKDFTENTQTSDIKRDTLVKTEEDAKKIIEEMYYKGLMIYGFRLDIRSTTNIKYGTYIVDDYNTIVDNIFTNNGRKQFEEYYKDYLIINENIAYIKDKSNILETIGYDVQITNLNIENNIIECTIKSVYLQNEKIIKKESNFLLVYESNIWKIENFARPF